MSFESVVESYFDKLWERGKIIGADGISYSQNIKTKVNRGYDKDGIYAVSSFTNINLRIPIPSIKLDIKIDETLTSGSENQIFVELDKLIVHKDTKRKNLKEDLKYLSVQAMFLGCVGEPKIEVSKLSGRFILDALEKPSIYHNVMYLSGLAVPEKKIQIAKGTMLRRLVKEDFELSYNPLNGIPPMPPLFHHSITCALEYDISGNRIESMGRADELARRYTLILRLYASYPIWNVYRKSAGLGTTGSMRYGSRDYYKLKETEITNLLDFWNRIEKTDIDRLMFKKGDYLSSSFDQYTELVVYSGYAPLVTGRLVSILETIYKYEDRSNSSTVKQRISKLFGFIGFDALEVYSKINEAYSIRNKVFHGDIIDAKISARAYELNKIILDYVRLSIIIFLNVADKKDFLRTISDSLLDHKLDNKIKVILAGNKLLPLQSTKIVI